MPQERLQALILTNLPVEFKAVRAFLKDSERIKHPLGNIFEQGIFEAQGRIWQVGIVEMGTGSLDKAIQTERAIAFFDPQVLMSVGIAGGIKDVDIGHVVVSTKIYGYESSKYGEKFNSRPMIGLNAGDLAKEAKAEARRDRPVWVNQLSNLSVSGPTIPKVWVGPIAAGERVLASTESNTFQFLRQNYEDALAIEMEGYGSLLAIQNLSKTIFAIVVRGISDLIHSKGNATSQEPEDIQQEKAAMYASAFSFHLLAEFEKLHIQRQPKRKQGFTEPLIKLDLMLIPGGTFTMGSPEDELGRYSDEGPQHDVTVPTFLMGRYAITQAQWRTIATRTNLKVKITLDPDPSEFKGDDRPVEKVSWHDAVEFCQRLSRLTSHTYRLPTEAEWEYACRAGTDTPFHFGESITTDLANYRGKDREDDPEKYPGNYGNGPKGFYRKETTTVNHFHPLANTFGLCDLHGNVWEWCLDHWHDNYEGAPIDGSAWLTEDEESGRVIRGGSWLNNPRNCRSAYRLNSDPGDRNDTVGFRVVCAALDS